MKIRVLMFYLLVSAGLAWGFYEFLALPEVAAWFAGVNIVTFLTMGKDKAAAKVKMRRTPEFALLGLALAGGFPGMFAARRVFNHKTTKVSFIVPMWILFVLQLSLSAWFFGDLEALGFKKKDLPVQKNSAQQEQLNPSQN